MRLDYYKGGIKWKKKKNYCYLLFLDSLKVDGQEKTTLFTLRRVDIAYCQHFYLLNINNKYVISKNWY